MKSFGSRAVLESSGGVFREGAALYPAVSVRPRSCSGLAPLSGPSVRKGVFAVPPAVRHYGRVAKEKKTAPESRLRDLPATTPKMEYAGPLAQTTDELVKRRPSLELESQVKKDRLIAKVQRDENDRNPEEVQVAILSARFRNYQEHLQQHHEDRASKRRMLMAADRRKKLLKNLRLVRFDTFERCEQLGVTYTFRPEDCRRAARRWLAKKELCLQVVKAAQKQEAERRMKQHRGTAETEEAEAAEAPT
ncbi:LOW QUALITY PROTEIN: small ribosomal subunit protein uS15m-like [Anableps anableps]